MGGEGSAAKEVASVLGDTLDEGALDLVESKQSKELVLGFCGPAGSGISSVKEKVRKILQGSHNYKIVQLKFSEFIEKYSANDEMEGENGKDESSEMFKRAGKLQDKGNKLRELHGNEILAAFAVRRIGLEREKKELRMKGDRIAYLLDSLKHPDELMLLRAVYGNIFHLFGVLCPEPERAKRLETKGMKEEETKKFIQRDINEDKAYGQKMAKTLKDADFFIRNTDPDMEKLEKRIKRFVDLVLGKSTITPTLNEYAMYVAESSAARSGCLSRQVGAAIMDKEGNIVSTGTNDVPKFGGGLYPDHTNSVDNRCYRIHGESCKNDQYKNDTLEKIQVAIRKQGVDGKQTAEIMKEIEDQTRIKSLIEFSRAVHAEMDAIIAVARNGNTGTKGCALFTTTFPCHNCARHIVAAGIERVYYIEPYEKSLAYDLHSDSIDLEDKGTNGSERVKFLHYEGVAPSRYLSYFRVVDVRKKEDGRLKEYAPSESSPVITENLFSYEDLENKVAEQLEKKGLKLN